MDQKENSVNSSKPETGWIFYGLLALGFIIQYLLNILLPLYIDNYAVRIWTWAEWSLSAGALLVIALRWRSIRLAPVLAGAGLGIASGISRGLHDHSLVGGITEGAAVWLTFTAGTILFQDLARYRVAAFQPPWTKIFSNLGFGLLVAVPLAGINTLFFFLQNGAPQFQNVWASALEALSPGIHEEAIYRYFVLAVCFTLLQDSSRRRLAMAASVSLALFPHSLLHLPDLFMADPVTGLVMLAATSLLFGLPMVALQIKRSFESAVIFHWFIDFVRFFFGY